MTPSFYPPWPVPSSNAIGRFIIGVSQIGTVPPFIWQDTVISQYANSAQLLQMIADFSMNIDQTENFDDFYDLIWNVLTAQGYGLDVWGRIVGLSGRAITISSVQYFGFEEADNAQAYPFGQEPFYVSGALTSNYILTDDAYRSLILAKAAFNICDGSISAINTLLRNLFPNRGNCYVADNVNMTVTYTFSFPLTPVELSILGQTGILPTPCGVSSTISAPS